MITIIILIITALILCIVIHSINEVRKTIERQNLILLESNKDKLGDKYQELMEIEKEECNKYVSHDKNNNDNNFIYM